MSGFSVQHDSQVQMYKGLRKQYLAEERQKKEDLKQRRRDAKSVAGLHAKDTLSTGHKLSFAKMLKRVGGGIDVLSRGEKKLRLNSNDGSGYCELLEDNDKMAGGRALMDLKGACAMEMPREVL